MKGVVKVMFEKNVKAVEKHFKMTFKEAMEMENKNGMTKKKLHELVNKVSIGNHVTKIYNFNAFAKLLKEHGVHLENIQNAPTNHIKVAQGWAKKHGHNHMTSIEAWTAYELKKMNVDYVNEAKFEVKNKVNKKKIVNPDFMVGNKVIEVNGDFFHANPTKFTELNDMQKKNVENDKLKEEAYKANGYEVLFIWEAEIKTMPAETIEKIENFLKN